MHYYALCTLTKICLLYALCIYAIKSSHQDLRCTCTCKTSNKTNQRNSGPVALQDFAGSPGPRCSLSSAIPSETSVLTPTARDLRRSPPACATWTATTGNTCKKLWEMSFGLAHELSDVGLRSLELAQLEYVDRRRYEGLALLDLALGVTTTPCIAAGVPNTLVFVESAQSPSALCLKTSKRIATNCSGKVVGQWAGLLWKAGHVANKAPHHFQQRGVYEAAMVPELLVRSSLVCDDQSHHTCRSHRLTMRACDWEPVPKR